jgi:hypothetical protein
MAHESINPKMYQEDLALKEVEIDPISFKGTMDPDTLYMHEAMKAPDTEHFKEAMRKEVNEHTRKGHWRVIPKEDVPSHSNILPAVWSMKNRNAQGLQAQGKIESWWSQTRVWCSLSQDVFASREVDIYSFDACFVNYTRMVNTAIGFCYGLPPSGHIHQSCVHRDSQGIRI